MKTSLHEKFMICQEPNHSMSSFHQKTIEGPQRALNLSFLMIVYYLNKTFFLNSCYNWNYKMKKTN